MIALLVGLFLFLGVHSTRIVADEWRSAQIARRGEGAWKGLYSVVSVVGLALIVWGYALARRQPMLLWDPPAWTRYAAALLTLLSFVLLAAAYVPGNALKASLGHPMLLGVKSWALAHLIANGTLADVLLFGSFLLWAVLCFRAARRRDRAVEPGGSPSRVAGTAGATIGAIAAGIGAWVVFAFWAHGWLFGVTPLG